MRQLLEERDRLSSQLTGCQQLYAEQQQSLTTAQNELARERESLKEVSASKDQLVAELSAARSTIDGLSTQVRYPLPYPHSIFIMSLFKVVQLSSSGAIEKLRVNYDSALRTASDQHAQEVAHLQMELGAVREQLHQLVVKKQSSHFL